MIDRENLNRLADYRRRMGITQAMLAYDLKTTRVQIALAEKGQRLLSPESELIFIKLLEINPPPSNLPVAYSQQMIIAEDTAFQQSVTHRKWRLTEVTYYGEKLKKKLADSKKRYAKESNTIQLLEASIAEHPGHPGYTALRDKLVRKIRKCDLLAQNDMQYQIDLYKLEEKFLQWQLEQMTAPPRVEMTNDISSEQMLLTERFDVLLLDQEVVEPPIQTASSESPLPQSEEQKPEEPLQSSNVV